MSEKELLEKIMLLEKRVAELEQEVGYIKDDIYEYVEDDECGCHCGCDCECDDECDCECDCEE